MEKVKMILWLQMARPVPESEALSSGNVILILDDGRRVSLDFFLTGTNIEGNTYTVELDDENMAWPEPEEDCYEIGIDSVEPSDFSTVKGVEELFLYSEDHFVPGQAIMHAEATLYDNAGASLCTLSDKEFALTDFGEFYTNMIAKQPLAGGGAL